MAWYVLSTKRSWNARLSSEYACSDLATTIRPLVPASRRWTMPARSDAPEVAMRYPAPARAPRTVGPVQPTDGCAATPTGLSITIRSSSSWTTVSSGTCIGTMTGAWRGCHDTSSHEPAWRRSDFDRATPSAVTPPASMTSTAKLREKPISLANAVSVRSPASPSGSGRLRVSTVRRRRGLSSSVEPHAPDRKDDEQPHAGHDEDVRHIENGREAPDLDEVDHVAQSEARFAQQAVYQVAQRAAQQHPEQHRPGQRPDAMREHDDEHGDRGCCDREDPGRPAGQRESGAGILDEDELQQLPDD